MKSPTADRGFTPPFRGTVETCVRVVCLLDYIPRLFVCLFGWLVVWFSVSNIAETETEALCTDRRLRLCCVKTH